MTLADATPTTGALLKSGAPRGSLGPVVCGLAAMLGWAQPDLPQSPAYDLVLRNGRIVDGSGSPWYRADLAIRGDTIVRIAPSIAEEARRVIDMEGQVVAPGFIDVHTHARRGIFE